jgi:predicted ATPase
MCLVALLLEPEAELPRFIVVDEPELGLYPYALNLIASLFRAAFHQAQVLITTQSSPLRSRSHPEHFVQHFRITVYEPAASDP